MSLQEMREQLRQKYERLRKREEERRRTLLKYYEPIEAEAPPWLPPLKRKERSNPDFFSHQLLRWKTCPDPKCLCYKTAELTEAEFCKRCGSKLEIVPEERFRRRSSLGSHSNPPELEELINRVRIIAEYGKDPEAEALLRRLAMSFVLLRPRDLWKYLYDWTQEALELLEARKIKIPAR